MAAKKKSTKRGKASDQPKPAQHPIRAPEAHEEVSAPPEEIALGDKLAGPPVAGIGASAGGLEAFKKFFTAMPADSGAAFVLIPHLDRVCIFYLGDVHAAARWG